MIILTFVIIGFEYNTQWLSIASQHGDFNWSLNYSVRFTDSNLDLEWAEIRVLRR